MNKITKNTGKKCNENDCCLSVYSVNLCRKHYLSKRNNDAKKGKIKFRKCSVDECEKMHLAGGLCSMHYAQTPHIRMMASKYEKTAKRREYCHKKRNNPVNRIKSRIYCSIRYLYDESYKLRVFESTRRRRKTLVGKVYQSNYMSMRRAAGNVANEIIEKLWKDTSVCQICQNDLDDDRHLDHVIPICIGGRHEIGNLRYVHPKCNMKRPNDGSDIFISPLFSYPN